VPRSWHYFEEAPGIFLVLKPNDQVIGVSHDSLISASAAQQAAIPQNARRWSTPTQDQANPC
jgi:hypothetical protein